MILRHCCPGGSLALAIFAIFAISASAQSPTDAEKASNASLLWGPYRPNLYFGVRPRIPQAITLGLMWAAVEDYRSVQENWRYTCEQNEGMAGYGWEEYDARSGGRQVVHDAGNQIDITTSFYKDVESGNWGARIKGVPREDAPENLKTTVVVNVNLEGKPGVFSNLAVEKADDEGSDWFMGDVVLKGETPQLGAFELVVKGDEGTENRHPTHAHPSANQKSLDRTLVNSKIVEEGVVWQSKPLFFAVLKQQIDEYIETYTQENLPPPAQLFTLKPEPGPGNVHFIQKVFGGAFEFDIVFNSRSTAPMTSESFTFGLAKISKTFNDRFTEVFKPQAPFTSQKYIDLGKSLFSNLLGGIGYFYGDWKVDRSASPAYDEENEGFWEEAAEARSVAPVTMAGPNELFSSIPSRPFFPRGFLWDEGFHLLPVLDWDPELTLQIIKSWFSLIDEDGWIAREQILGAEARSKVPDEFQVQYPHYANPPTLFLTLSALIDRLTSPSASTPSSSDPQKLDSTTAKAHLAELYPLLKRHYNWFRQTQKGDLTAYDRPNTAPKEAYRWRGRTERHCLTSGLDDFPRAQPPHPGELHVDALSWVGVMARSLGQIATFLGETEDAEALGKQLSNIQSNLRSLHWDPKTSSFCDATIDEFEEHVLICHKGYVTLMPFMVGLLDPVKDAEKIGKILETIGNPEELWSAAGIRSLSSRDELYGTDENYWRSPVWVNMNYLILQQLLSLSTPPPTTSPSAAEIRNAKEAASLYKRLRTNLVNTVYKSWEDTGFAWEQYDPETGRGQRTQHFTGWTSLVVKILGMPEDAAMSGAKSKGGKGRDEL